MSQKCLFLFTSNWRLLETKGGAIGLVSMLNTFDFCTEEASQIAKKPLTIYKTSRKQPVSKDWVKQC